MITMYARNANELRDNETVFTETIIPRRLYKFIDALGKEQKIRVKFRDGSQVLAKGLVRSIEYDLPKTIKVTIHWLEMLEMIL